MYRSGTDVLILDDPLSAVDPHVAHAIFDKCIVGLAGDQTRLLVVNSHYDLLARADQVVVIQDGAISAQGSPEEVLSRCPYLAAFGARDDGKKEDDLTTGSAEVVAAFVSPAGENLDRLLEDTADAIKPAEEGERDTNNAVEVVNEEKAGKLIRAEDRVKGKVGGRGYKTYFDETGFNGLVVIFVIVAAYVAGQAARTVVDWWPGHWARNMPRRGVDSTYSGTTYGMWYLGFLVLCAVLSFGRALMIIESCVRSSQNMHDELFRRVLKVPVTRYFDVTPMGQILNRFSSDLDQMDSVLPTSTSCCYSTRPSLSVHWSSQRSLRTGSLSRTSRSSSCSCTSDNTSRSLCVRSSGSRGSLERPCTTSSARRSPASIRFAPSAWKTTSRS